MDNTEDVIDSRDVIERIEELESLTNPECTCERTETIQTHEPECPVPAGAADEDLDELKVLRAFADEATEWDDGVTLVRDSYFQDYARDLADEIGALPAGDQNWPAYCIDWEWAARELRMDYSAYDFDGVTYWGRA